MECSICLNLLTEEGELAPNTTTAQGSPKRPKVDKKPTSGGTPQLCSPPCGHIFHRICLVNWLERGNDNCPTCRKEKVTKRQLKPVFLPSAPSLQAISTSPPTTVDTTTSTCKNCEELKRQLEELKKKMEVGGNGDNGGTPPTTPQAVMDDTIPPPPQKDEKERKWEEEKAQLNLKMVQLEIENGRLEGQLDLEKRRGQDEARKTEDLKKKYDQAINDLSELRVQLFQEEDKNAVLENKVTDLESQLVQQQQQQQQINIWG